MQLAFHFLSFCLLHSIKERLAFFHKELLRPILACQSGVISGYQPQEAISCKTEFLLSLH